jgi:hypothetical protein
MAFSFLVRKGWCRLTTGRSGWDEGVAGRLIRSVARGAPDAPADPPKGPAHFPGSPAEVNAAWVPGAVGECLVGRASPHLPRVAAGLFHGDEAIENLIAQPSGFYEKESFNDPDGNNIVKPAGSAFMLGNESDHPREIETNAYRQP